MIQFNELRITPDAKYLIIDAFIKNDPNLYNYIISDIVVYNIPNANKANGDVIYEKHISIEDLEIYSLGDKVLVDNEESVYIDEGVKHIRILLSQKDLNTSLFKGLFKVVISTSRIDTSIEEVPSEYASTSVTSLVMDLYPFYKESICLLKNIDCDCPINKELTNLILRFKALELSIKTGDVSTAVNYWFKYFNTLDRVFPKNKCNCHE